MVREVAVKERAEVDEGLGKADRAPAVQHQVRSVAVVVRVDPRRAIHGLCLALLARRAHVHEEPEKPQVRVNGIGPGKEGRARSNWRCGVVGVKARPEAELKFPQIRPVRAGDFASSFPLRARVGPVPQLRVRWHGLLQRLQASLHDEEEESRAKRATLLDAHRARHLHGLSVQVKGHLEVHVHALDDVGKVRWYAHLGEHRPEHVPRHRVKRLDQVHEQHPRLQPVLPPLLQSLADAKAPVCDTSTAGKAVLLFEADHKHFKRILLYMHFFVRRNRTRTYTLPIAVETMEKRRRLSPKTSTFVNTDLVMEKMLVRVKSDSFRRGAVR